MLGASANKGTSPSTMLEWLGALCVPLLLLLLALLVLRPGREESLNRCTSDPGTVSFVCKPSALANHLLRQCPSFNTLALAPVWSWRAHPLLHTLLCACRPSHGTVRFTRDHLQVSDDGLVSLDWADAESNQCKRRRTSSASTCPVLLIIPNSFGMITNNVLQLCEVALTRGYKPVVFNRRSHNGTPLTTPKLQQFGDPTDLREAVRYIRYRQPAGRIYAVSESTGSGLLLSYLGECGSSSYVTAATCLSPVFRCQSWFESRTLWACRWAMLLYQKACLGRYKTALGEVLPMDAVISSNSLRGLEESLFCQPGPKAESPAASWDSYWERNEPLRDVDEVAVPVLCVCSQDDPVRGELRSTVPLELFQSNPHFFMLLTRQGGHCSFAAPDESGTSWSHTALLEFFHAATDFFVVEERAKLGARRRGHGVFRHRSGSTCKRVPIYSPSIRNIDNWQRSYTR